MGKERQQRNHFKRRLEERYNLSLPDGEIDYIIARIRKNDTPSLIKYITKQSNRLIVFSILHKSIEFVAVYDKFRKQLVTALPIACKNANNICFYTEEDCL